MRPKGFRHSEETKRKMKFRRLRRKETLGYINSEETKRKISLLLKEKYKSGGLTPYWLGKERSKETKEKLRMKTLEQFKNGMSAEIKMKVGQKSREMWNRPGYKEKLVLRIKKCDYCKCFLGKKVHSCKPVWNKGKRGLQIHSRETRDKMRLISINRWKDELYRKKISDKLKGRKISDEHLKKSLKRRDKSSLEKRFEEIINKYNLPYKFVGNGDFLIGKKCPDFINVNGDKIAIEVYCRIHKQYFRNGLDNWRIEREKIFNEYGWRLLFFDEIELKNEELILNKIGGENYHEI